MNGTHEFVGSANSTLRCVRCGVVIHIPKGSTLDESRLQKCTSGKPTGEWPYYLIDTELWARSGFARRSNSEAITAHNVCKGCGNFDQNTCKLIGSGLTGVVLLARKCIMATEECPLGKWKARVTVRGMSWKPYRMPSLAQRIRHYALAVARWLGRGRPVRSRIEIEIIWRICTKCSYFDNGKCRECGCRLSDRVKPLSNKIAMATEHCPKGKW